MFHREDYEDDGGGDGKDTEHDADQGEEPGPGELRVWAAGVR